MEHPEISSAKNGPQHEINSSIVKSAFKILGDLPKLFDYIFINFGSAYNNNNGKFGRIKAVGVPKRGKASAPFTKEESEFRVPDGFIVPVLYGLKALLKIENGSVVWSENPYEFIKNHLDSLIKAFKMPMEWVNFDPQKLAKSEKTYQYMQREVERIMLENKHKN